MALTHRVRVRTIILSAVILLVGIIHLGVGIGIVAKYRKFGDTFQQQVGLSGYDIFLGLFTIVVGLMGLVTALKGYPSLSKITAIASFLLGILALSSLIAALALSGQTASYLDDTLTDNINRYNQDDDSISIVDNIQTTYQCCGVNLWLDWARISLGTSTGILAGRRRRRSSLRRRLQNLLRKKSPLTRALRQKRQIIPSDGNVYNLPSSYSFNLPLSCCKSGGTTVGNSLGGYCVFSASNGTSSFYVAGCLEPISNIGFSQITGIAVINTCLTILAFVFFAKLITVFRTDNNQNNKQPNQNEVYQNQQWQQWQQQPQQQQYPYNQYYTDYSNSAPYYITNDSTYKTYL